MAALIADFGKKADGYNLYRINGSKQEIISAIEMIKNVGCEVLPSYKFEIVHGSQCTALIKVWIPEANRKQEG